MQAVFIEVPAKELTIPRTLQEYRARIKSDSQWYYSHDAIVFRVWYKMRIWLKGKVDENDLRNALDFCLREENDTARRRQDERVG